MSGRGREAGVAAEMCVRGLLCLPCNTALGLIERTYELARAYLVDQLKARRGGKRNRSSVRASPSPASADGTGTTGPMSPSGDA